MTSEIWPGLYLQSVTDCRRLNYSANFVGFGIEYRRAQNMMIMDVKPQTDHCCLIVLSDGDNTTNLNHEEASYANTHQTQILEQTRSGETV